jgi:hypothetical protein
MAASSSSSSSTHPRNKRGDRLRPQDPINTLGSSTLPPKPSPSPSTPSSSTGPWLLKPDQISISAACRRHVVLVLGGESPTRSIIITFHLQPFPLSAPSERCVAALLSSRSLVHSLVIFASHTSPILPHNPTPTVRVLRLASPLAVEDTGAVRLVSTLEWAERAARVWRASGSGGADVVCYDEAAKDVPTSFSRSVESLGERPSRPNQALPVLPKRRLSTNSARPGVRSGGSLPPIDPSQRPFDAILNYISYDVAEKQVLKQIILITSITRPFLAPTLSPYHKLSEAKRKRRNSASRHGSVCSLPPTPPHQSGDLPARASSSMTTISALSMSTVPSLPAHTIHIIPPTARIGLVRSLDSFLSSFSKPVVATDEVEHARQYVLSDSTLRETVAHPHLDRGECTVLDLILLGGLDSVSGKSWIGSGQDIFPPPTPSSSSPPSPPPKPVKPPKPVRSPSKSPSDSPQPVDPVPPPRKRAQPSPPLSGGPPRKTRGSSDRKTEQPQPVFEQERLPLSAPRPRPNPVRNPRPRGLYEPSSLDPSSGRSLRRSRRHIDTKPGDPVLPTTSGLPTPPDSDEGAWYTSPRLRTPVSEAPAPQKKRLKWQFWKS